ncbi:hypothetical protein [Pedobacter gandavensis]|uniref:hypothetical protein n=1 Tax=Pedobacter gandavensis TaxID=2679963 RepID=UPI00292EE3B4|nr:hypothetical protein [Pedobacter gandavensis]
MSQERKTYPKEFKVMSVELSSGIINYFKIVNGDKMGKYVLTVNDIKSGKRINNRLVLLDYKLNDKFKVLKNTFM